MSRDEVIGDILLNWEELREQGQEPALEELCRDHPEVRGEVDRRIRALRKMYQIPNAAQAPTQPVGVPTVPVDARFPVAGLRDSGTAGKRRDGQGVQGPPAFAEAAGRPKNDPCRLRRLSGGNRALSHRGRGRRGLAAPPYCPDLRDWPG